MVMQCICLPAKLVTNPCTAQQNKAAPDQPVDDRVSTFAITGINRVVFASAQPLAPQSGQSGIIKSSIAGNAIDAEWNFLSRNLERSTTSRYCASEPEVNICANRHATMKRGTKWAIGPGIAITVTGAVWLAALWWLPSDEDLAMRLAAEAEVRLGVKVTIGSAHWALLPMPVVVINDFRTQQTQPVVCRELRAYLKPLELLRRKLVFERIEIADAVFPHSAVRAFRNNPHEIDENSGILLERIEFRNATWIDYSGIAVVYDGEIDFDPNWRPRNAELRRPGIEPAFKLTLTREADAERWQTRIHIGGGTAHGNIALKTTDNGAMQLSGQLAPHGVEVESAVRSFNRRSPIAGIGSGQTELSAGGRSAGELARSLHTRTTFSVHPASVLRFDLEKAIRTLGKERGGQTTLQTLTGQLDTQNTNEGMRATYTGLKANAGQYSATGKATVYHRHIEASGDLYVVPGATGVPFTVSGPVSKPKTSVPPGFFAGAAIGTAVLPGIGTAIGARVGGAIGRMFKSDSQSPASPVKVAPGKN